MTVTGAGGRTGKLVLQKLLAQPDRFNARGLVRDEKVLTPHCSSADAANMFTTFFCIGKGPKGEMVFCAAGIAFMLACQISVRAMLPLSANASMTCVSACQGNRQHVVF